MAGTLQVKYTQYKHTLFICVNSELYLGIEK